MIETIRHKEAFEYYYALGSSRSIPQVCQNLSVSIPAVKNWSKAFNWQDRVIQRDIENSKQLEIKTNKFVIDEKENYRKIIRDAIRGREILNAKNIKDLEILVKLDLLLMGEAIDQNLNINFNIPRPKKN